MDNNYFYKLNEKVIDIETENDLIKLGISKIDQFNEYKSFKTGLGDNNWIYSKYFYFFSIPKVIKLIKSCSIPCYPVYIKHIPNTVVAPHVDDPNKRNSVIIFPLLPTENYVVTSFYERGKDKNFIKVLDCDFSDRMPVLLNTQKYHGLKNNDSLRLNFQLCFEENFQSVKELIVTNKLFVN